MTDSICLWITILVWFLASGAIFIATVAFLARWFEIAVPVLGLGLPTLIRFHIGETEVRVGLLFVNAYATVLDYSNDDEFQDVNRDGRHLNDISLWKQIVFSLVGLAPPLILSVALVPWPELANRILTGLGDYVGGALDPMGRGQELLVKFIAIAHASIPHAVGIIATKSLLWIALPFLTSPTTAALNRIALCMGYGGIPKDVNLFVALVWLLPVYLPYLGWGIAAVVYTWHA